MKFGTHHSKSPWRQWWQLSIVAVTQNYIARLLLGLVFHHMLQIIFSMSRLTWATTLFIIFKIAYFQYNFMFSLIRNIICNWKWHAQAVSKGTDSLDMFGCVTQNVGKAQRKWRIPETSPKLAFKTLASKISSHKSLFYWLLNISTNFILSLLKDLPIF